MNIKNLLQFKGLGKNDTVMIDPAEVQGVARAENITAILLKGGHRVNVGVSMEDVLSEIDKSGKKRPDKTPTPSDGVPIKRAP